ncbi:DUF1700 domain-containing protein [Clostridium sp.]|uniref:DUF1700 domain-containing protein n=1 Tax=Clostridium sp. TaxID=1506 RepID=UPI002FCB995A
MNKNEFLSILASGLKDFPEKELADILFDYQEHFTIGKSNGKTEEEIIEELGTPYEIVYQYRSAYLEKVALNDEPDTSKYTEDDTKFYGDVNYETVCDDDFTKKDTSQNKSENTDQHTKPKKTGFFQNFAINEKSVLTIILIILGCIFLSPFIIGAGGMAFGLIVGFIGLLIGLVGCGFALTVSGIAVILSKVGLVVLGASETPNFILDFPNSVIILFIIGSLALTILVAMLVYYFIKWLFITIINLFKKNTKGGN